jgi:hypothetical protein
VSTSWGSSGGSGAVSSVFGRTGSVVATATDYSSVALVTEAVEASGLSGLSAGRFVGMVNGAAPSSGTWLLGDYVVDVAGGGQGGWVCNVAGTPGTWTAFAALNSPVFTGTPKVPTATAGDSSNQIADTAFVANALSSYSPALSKASGAIASDVALPSLALTSVFSTSSLATGTWLVLASVLIQDFSDAAEVDIELVVGTATATLAGVTAQSAPVSAGGANCAPATLSAIATVTVAGTLTVKAYNGESNTVTARHATPEGYAGCTGYVAVKIA